MRMLKKGVDKSRLRNEICAKLFILRGAEQVSKAFKEELVEAAARYRLSIDFTNYIVSDWGDLGDE